MSLQQGDPMSTSGVRQSMNRQVEETNQTQENSRKRFSRTDRNNSQKVGAEAVEHRDPKSPNLMPSDSTRNISETQSQDQRAEQRVQKSKEQTGKRIDVLG